MRRRDFIAMLSGTAAAWPLSAHTQQSTKRLIGVLSNPSGDGFEALFPAFHRGLSESGYVDEFAQSAPAALQRITDAAGVSLILILSDINMPGMSGLELLPKAKALRPDVPSS